jgi:hypothetical protein
VRRAIRELSLLTRTSTRRNLSVGEREQLATFAAMTLPEVRARADQFELAVKRYADWATSRRERRSHAADPEEQRDFPADVQYGDVARQWRRLETTLRERGLWQVSELSASEMRRWAHRVNALSLVLREPTPRWLGPRDPAAKRRQWDREIPREPSEPSGSPAS